MTAPKGTRHRVQGTRTELRINCQRNDLRSVSPSLKLRRAGLCLESSAFDYIVVVYNFRITLIWCNSCPAI